MFEKIKALFKKPEPTLNPVKLNPVAAYKQRIEREFDRMEVELEKRKLPKDTILPTLFTIRDVQINVMSQGNAERYCYYPAKGDRTAVVSISDEWYCHRARIILAKEGRPGVKKLLREFFDDEEIGGKNVISAEQAERIASFIRDQVFAPDSRINRLIIHCEMGKSRSAAVAAATVRWLGEDDMGFFTSNVYHPNKTVYCRMLDAFKHIEEVTKTHGN